MDIKEIIERELTQNTITKLGIEGESDEVKIYLLSKFSEVVFNKIIVEVLRILPEHKRVEFESLVGTGNPDALHTCIQPFIPDVEKFIREIIANEIKRLQK